MQAASKQESSAPKPGILRNPSKPALSQHDAPATAANTSPTSHSPAVNAPALQHAIYNAIALVGVGLLCLAVVTLYYCVLGVFLRPLAWALCCGSMLHPLKRSLTATLRCRLHHLASRRVLLVVAVVLAPLWVLHATARECKRVYETHRAIVLGVPALLAVLYCVYRIGLGPFFSSILLVLIHLLQFIPVCLEMVSLKFVCTSLVFATFTHIFYIQLSRFIL